MLRVAVRGNVSLRCSTIIMTSKQLSELKTMPRFLQFHIQYKDQSTAKSTEMYNFAD